MSIKSAKDMVATASANLETLSAEDALKLAHDPNVVFVDVREGQEVGKTGKLEKAVHAPRGLLEFQADPASPSHNKALSGEKRLVLYCASGNRSALAGATLKSMGFTNVAHVGGGFAALQKAGAKIESSS